MKTVKKLSIVFALLAAILVSPMATFAEEPGSESSGITSNAQTGINLQNVSSTETKATVSLIPQGSGSEVSLGEKTIPALSAVNYYMPNYNGEVESPNVPSGTYSLVATADQPLEAIVKTEYANASGTVGGAGIYSSVQPGSNVIVPLIMKDWNGQTSNFTVQNANSTSSATVDINLKGPGKTDAYATETVTLEAGKSVTYSLGEAPFNPPNNGEAVDPDNPVAGFLGFVQVTATSSSASQDIVVQSFIDYAGTNGVGSFSGVSADSAKTELYAPLIRRDWAGVTGIQLVNPGSNEANITITYYTDRATVDEYIKDNNYADSYEETVTLAANNSTAIFQGLSEQLPAAGASGLGWLGVARISSSQPILAVVNDVVLDAKWANQSQGTYNAATSDDAGTTFALPLVRKGFVGFTSGVQVQNITSSDVTCDVTYNASFADGTTKSYAGGSETIPANSTKNIYQGFSTAVIPDYSDTIPGWYGSASITCSGNVVMVVNDAHLEGTIDSANYNALKAE